MPLSHQLHKKDKSDAWNHFNVELDGSGTKTCQFYIVTINITEFHVNLEQETVRFGIRKACFEQVSRE